MVKRMILFVVILLWTMGLLVGCSKKPTPGEKEVLELAKQAAAHPDNIKLQEELMLRYLGAEQTDNAIKLYTENREKFKDNVLIKCYYGSALCLKGGALKDLDEKLLWLKKGMIFMDKLVDEYPDSKDVYIWKGYTYSYFPGIMGARAEAEKNLNIALDRYDKKDWQLSIDDLNFIFSGFLNIAQEYGDLELLENSYKRMKPYIPEGNGWFDGGYRYMKEKLTSQ